MSFIDSLNWRAATKSFDKTKKISESELNKVLTAIQMAPTSFGLQPFYVRRVQNPEIRKKLQEAAFGQDQLDSASELLVFVRTTNVANRVDEFFTAKSGGKSEVRLQMKASESTIMGFVQSKDENFLNSWTAKQVYIALGFALAAAAELRLDSCPMEGFNPEKFDEILKLPKGDFSTVILALGYRNPNQSSPPKFRFPIEQLIRN